jgi:hypothetical protein
MANSPAPGSAETSAAAAAEAPSATAQKTAATVQRNKAERREERLEDIRTQTADGSLIVRQMTTAEHEVATGVANEVRERSTERKKRYRSPGDRAG